MLPADQLSAWSSEAQVQQALSLTVATLLAQGYDEPTALAYAKTLVGRALNRDPNALQGRQREVTNVPSSPNRQ